MKVKKRKKKIDENDFEGKPIGPPKKHERSLDLTDHIKNFIAGPIDIEWIKIILLRLAGEKSDVHIDKAKMKIYALEHSWKDLYIGYDFIIIIKCNEHYHRFWLASMELHKLGFIGSRDLDKSILKQHMRHKMWEWLNQNMHEVIKIEK